MVDGIFVVVKEGVIAWARPNAAGGEFDGSGRWLGYSALSISGASYHINFTNKFILGTPRQLDKA